MTSACTTVASAPTKTTDAMAASTNPYFTHRKINKNVSEDSLGIFQKILAREYLKLVSFFGKMANRLWEEYQHWSAEAQSSSDKIAELRSLLRRGPEFKRMCAEMYSEDRSNNEETLVRQLTDLLEQNNDMEVHCAKRMGILSRKLQKKGYHPEAFMIEQSMREVDAHKDDDWKLQADEHLEKSRPCKRKIHSNVETIVPFGASGFFGSTSDDSGEVDVLDASCPSLPGDSADVLRIFDEEADKKGIAKPSKVIKSGVIVSGSYRVEPALAVQLKPHQREVVPLALERLSQDEGFLIAHAPGLGKTLSTLAILQGVFSQFKQCKVLILCPKSLLMNWYEEGAQWDGISYQIYPPIENDSLILCQRWSRKGGVLIMTTDRFRRSWQTNPSLIAPDLLVVDEAHVLKSQEVLVYKAIQALATRKVLLLSGSPLQNNLSEYLNMIKLVDSSLDESMLKKIEQTIDRGSLADSTLQQISEARSKTHLIGKLTEKFVHRKSAAILAKALPPMQEYKLTYDFNFSGLSDQGGCFEKTQEVITVSMKAKIRLASALLSEILRHGDAALIFSKRKDVLVAMTEKHQGDILDGASTGTERYNVVSRFQNGECDILYLTTQTGAVGFNLFRANRILILDPSWNPVWDKQACGRAYRYGQTKSVFIYRFIAHGSIEETIWRIGIYKNAAACRILDDKKIERYFTHDQLKQLQLMQEDTLTTTSDSVLNAMITDFTSVTSHDTLFAASGEDTLTPLESADAENQFNYVTKYLPYPVMWQTTDKLLPPVVPCFKDFKETSSDVLMHPIKPWTFGVTYTIQVEEDDGCILSHESKNLESFMAQNPWNICLSNSGKHRVRYRQCIGDEVSDWSDWSAPMHVL